MSGLFDEQARLDILAAHDAADFQDHGPIQALTGLAAEICAAPICLVSLVDSARQHFIARTGIEADQTPRELSFCQHAMIGTGLMIIPDAAADPRFAANPLVTGPPHVRFYAGAPLRSAEGAPLGALCVIDHAPRAGLTPLQQKTLRVLADQVMAALDARRRSYAHAQSDHAFEAALAERESRFRTLADAMPQMVWSTQPDGFHDYYNARWYEFTGAPPGSTDGEAWNGMFHPEDRDRAWSRWRHSLATGEPYEIEYRLRNAAGEYRWTLGRALPMRDAAGRITRWFGTCTDIHEHKLLLDQRELISQELSHRIKNIFSIISGMISLAARRQPELATIATDLRERIVALGRAHDFVRPHSEHAMPKDLPAGLHGALRTIFQPYDAPDGPRIRITGADPTIDDRSATPIALLFHELATNAAKYGALSRESGAVTLQIAEQDDAITMDWREQGGPPIPHPPATSGFGTHLIDIGAIRQLSGTITRHWHESGLHLTIRTPRHALSRPNA